MEETSASYIMGQEAADIVYCDADPVNRGPLVEIDYDDPALQLDSVQGHLDPDDLEAWLGGYNSRMDELMADD